MINSRKLRAGIVGCGRVSEHHLRHLSARPDVEIVGVVDPNLEAARTLAARFDVPNAYASLDAMLAAHKVDVVHVITPPSSHKEVALQAIEHGAHVLVEKPLTLEPEDAKLLFERARAKGVMVVPDFIQLFHPRMLDATRLIESGEYGRVVSVECDFGLYLGMPELREARGLHWSYQLPGGVLQNYITHPLYLVMRWTGATRKIHVAPRSMGTLPQELTDQIDVLIDGEQCSAHMTLTLATDPSPNVVRLLCERGMIIVDFNSMTMLTYRHGAIPASLARILPMQAWPMTRWTIRILWAVLRKKLLPYHGLQALFEQLYTAAGSGGPPPISPELTLAVSDAEHEILSRSGKLHVDATHRVSKQKNVTQRERVLVTGAAGYLGQRVVKKLVEEGYYVRALARPLSQIGALEKLGVEIQFVDLRDEAAMVRAGEGMDVILHVGAAIRGNLEFMLDSTVGGTKAVAAAAKAGGAKRVIYISSMAVYDFGRTNGRITAESPLEERAAERGGASLAKREAEDVALEHTKTSNWTILRPSLIFGGGRDALGMLGPKKGSRVICVGSPSSRMRLVHVDDVAAAVVVLMRNPDTAGRVYTLSHPEWMTYRDYFRTLPAETTRNVKPVYLRRWFIELAALCQRTMKRMRAQKGGMTRRQVQYLFADPLVDSAPMQQAGWKPSASLRSQVATKD
jgi:2-alkyl-3-oxoalkanoate reductase